MSKTSRIFCSALIIITLLATLLSCAPPQKTSDDGGGGGTPPPAPTPTLSSKITAAWTAYNNNDIAGAKIILAQAEDAYYPDVLLYAPFWNIYGWINISDSVTLPDYAQLGNAITNFDKALTYDSTFADAYVGRASVYLIQDQYPEATSDAATALALAPNYAPGHDNLTVAHLHLLLAQAYFYNGEIANAVIQVQAVNPGFTFTDNASLLLEIQTLTQALP